MKKRWIIQPILWTERPTGAVMGAGSLGPFFLWLFLPLSGALRRHTVDRSSWVYPDLTIVQNPRAHSEYPHVHCANHENNYIKECARYRPLRLFFCQFKYFGHSPNQRHLTRHNGLWSAHHFIQWFGQGQQKCKMVNTKQSQFKPLYCPWPCKSYLPKKECYQLCLGLCTK
jgi:hypothetical protein